MSFPWSDPQFWVVTTIAVGAVRILWTQVVPGGDDGDACSRCTSCAAGSAAQVRPPGARGGADDKLVVLGSGGRAPVGSDEA